MSEVSKLADGKDKNNILEKMQVLITDALHNGKSFEGFFSVTKNYVDFMKFLFAIASKELISKYICLIFNRLLETWEKPLAKQVAISSIFIQEIFGYSANVTYIISLKNKHIEFKWLIDIINSQYDTIVDDLVSKHILSNSSLVNIPNTVMTLSLKVDKLINLDYKVMKEYLTSVIRSILDNPSTILKNNDSIIHFVVDYIFGNAHILYTIKTFSNFQNPDKIDNFIELIKKQYLLIANTLVEECVNEKRPLSDIPNRVVTGMQRFVFFFSCETEKVEQYLEYYAEEYYQHRKLMSFWEFTSEIFGHEYIAVYNRDTLKSGGIEYYEKLKEITDRIYEKHGEAFVKTNAQQIEGNNDKWVLFFKKGPKYSKKEFDFSNICTKEYKYELKLFIMDELKRRDIANINTLQLAVPCINFIHQSNPKVRCFADISEIDVRNLYKYLEKSYITIHYKNLSPASMQKMIRRLGLVVEFLISYSKRNNLTTVKPVINIFKGIKFRNIQNMHKRTEIIPEEVVEQLQKYQSELRPRHSVLFDIFINSGIRLKEAILLTDNCLEDTEWENLKILKYKPYKVKNTAKKKSRPDNNELVIPIEVAEKIEQQKDASKSLREAYSLPYIFLHLNSETGQTRANITDGKGFVKAVNRIIKKHNIVDCDGVQWHFKSRQFRKTVVVTMIENHATRAEIAYVLGHYNLKTLQVYYEEVREKRVADMNSKFWENKFNIAIGKDNLEKFTEEESKILYMDFICGYRKVELGFCSKHYSEGECGIRTGKQSCGSCEKLCTGKQFLTEWFSLRDSQRNIVMELENHYKKKNIIPQKYYEFKEYKKEEHFLKLYQSVIDSILTN